MSCCHRLALLPHLGVPVHGRGGVGALLVAHHLVLVPGQPAVGAARQDAVGLLVATDVAGVQRAGKPVVVDERVAGVDAGHVVAAVGPHRHRPVFPVQQVGGAGVSPADSALAAVRVHRAILVEQVVDAVVVDGAVGIVDPTLRRREVVDRPVRVACRHPAAQFPGGAAKERTILAGNRDAKVAHLPGPLVRVHPWYLLTMSMIRPMSSRAAASGVRHGTRATMQSWKWRSSRRKGLSQSTAGSVR